MKQGNPSVETEKMDDQTQYKTDFTAAHLLKLNCALLLFFTISVVLYLSPGLIIFYSIKAGLFLIKSSNNNLLFFPGLFLFAENRTDR